MRLTDWHRPVSAFGADAIEQWFGLHRDEERQVEADAPFRGRLKRREKLWQALLALLSGTICGLVAYLCFPMPGHWESPGLDLLGLLCLEAAVLLLAWVPALLWEAWRPEADPHRHFFVTAAGLRCGKTDRRLRWEQVRTVERQGNGWLVRGPLGELLVPAGEPWFDGGMERVQQSLHRGRPGYIDELLGPAEMTDGSLSRVRMAAADDAERGVSVVDAEPEQTR